MKKIATCLAALFALMFIMGWFIIIGGGMLCEIMKWPEWNRWTQERGAQLFFCGFVLLVFEAFVLAIIGIIKYKGKIF